MGIARRGGGFDPPVRVLNPLVGLTGSSMYKARVRQDAFRKRLTDGNLSCVNNVSVVHKRNAVHIFPHLHTSTIYSLCILIIIIITIIAVNGWQSHSWSWSLGHDLGLEFYSLGLGTEILVLFRHSTELKRRQTLGKDCVCVWSPSMSKLQGAPSHWLFVSAPHNCQNRFNTTITSDAVFLCSKLSETIWQSTSLWAHWGAYSVLQTPRLDLRGKTPGVQSERKESQWPRFESRVVPIFHSVATGKLFTHICLLSFSAPRNWGTKKEFSAPEWLWWLSALD